MFFIFVIYRYSVFPEFYCSYQVFAYLFTLVMIILQALAHSVRDRLIERSHDTQLYFKRKDPKRVYFLSFEYLMGIYVLPSELFYSIYGLWMMLVSVNLKPL